ncbi:ketopantoate reductase family protein [Paraburkholderia acidisoli]|uniref:2-dehydropantoate 2-reductase n=1 Tax=Paraburkholderia acidisoli TaxID=2571748 RepID=A0A7Z2JIB8_9BURK|nr:2-dehydropantoate 2-reductase [Paraburkholderia acidisoli]QGZ65033.1 2-dehydropantoate 2-reductase [Paraburkholderia acidisoli]
MNGAKRIAIVGAGAIGGHFAARLALAGHQVSMLARGATLRALAQHGLRYASPEQGERAIDVNASGECAALGEQDLVVIALKSHALPELAASLAPLMGARTVVLPVGNGLPWWYFLVSDQPLEGLRLTSVDPAGVIERAIDIERVLGGSVMASCSSPAPGCVVHHSGGKVVLGEPGGGMSERAAHWAQVLAAAGLGATASHDIRRDLWLKLLGNVCANPLSVLTQASTDRIVDDPLTHAVFADLMRECVTLGRRAGLAVDIDVAARLAQTRALGAIKTSMLQDLEAGRRLELDAILGAPLECAARVGFDAPLMRAVHALARLRAAQTG